jgi:hypothetical protein
MLNLHAWLIFELCSGVAADVLEREYLAIVAPSLPLHLARQQLNLGLAQLANEKLVEFMPAADDSLTPMEGNK